MPHRGNHSKNANVYQREITKANMNLTVSQTDTLSPKIDWQIGENIYTRN